MGKKAILVNLQRCTGCWTCSMSCKVANGLDAEDYRMFIRTLGNGTGMDEPAGVWPNVSMSFMPVYKQSCTFCGERVGQGLDPYCVFNCPTFALTFGDEDDPDGPFCKKVDELKERGYKIFQQPKYEDTRAQIYYAERV